MVVVNRVVVLAVIALLGGGALLWGVAPMPQSGSSERSYTMADRGGVSLITSGSAPVPAVTYTRIQPGAGSTTPSGVGIFGFRNSAGELLTETGVAASPLVTRGRVFVTFSEDILNTGLAIVNPNAEDVQIDFFFSDSRREDIDFGSGSFTVGANQQTARFISEAPFNAETGTRGALTFTASLPVSVVALRQSLRDSGEFTFSSMPVADLTKTSTDTIYLPHFVFGGPWSSRLIVVNPTDEEITGTMAFIDQGSPREPFGLTRPIALTGTTAQVHTYSLAPRGFREFVATDLFTGIITVGSFRLVPDDGNVAPIAQLILDNADPVAFETISEATISPAELGTAFRTYVEVVGEPGAVGSIQSGIAIASVPLVPTLDRTTVTLELTRLDGSLVEVVEIEIFPSGQRAFFVDEIFDLELLGSPFQGILRISATDRVTVAALRGRTNERSQFLMTTTPPTNEGGTTTTTELFFPHLVDGGGWTTQTILFSGIAGQVADGAMRFFGTDGSPFDIVLE